MLTNLKRVIGFAATDFSRNKGMSIAAVFILSITTLLISGMFLVQGVSSFLIHSVENKIDITAYFKQGTQEQDILNAKDAIMKEDPAIKSIQYVSQDQALADFNQKHQGDVVLQRALTEVGDNPFLPALNITTSGDPTDYQQVAQVLQSDQFSSLIDSVDYAQKKDTIQKIFSVTDTINKLGIVLGVILVLIAMAVVYNIIKLVVDRSHEEIRTMRVVGASNWFVKAPFIIEGIIFGLISFAICFIITAVASYFMSPGMELVLPGFSLIKYFVDHLWLVIIIQLFFGAGLAALSSYIVVRKYLKM